MTHVNQLPLTSVSYSRAVGGSWFLRLWWEQTSVEYVFLIPAFDDRSCPMDVWLAAQLRSRGYNVAGTQYRAGVTRLVDGVWKR